MPRNQIDLLICGWPFHPHVRAYAWPTALDPVRQKAGKEYSMEISTPGIDTAGFKPHQLANAGARAQMCVCAYPDDNPLDAARCVCVPIRITILLIQLCVCSSRFSLSLILLVSVPCARDSCHLKAPHSSSSSTLPLQLRLNPKS